MQAQIISAQCKSPKQLLERVPEREDSLTCKAPQYLVTVQNAHMKRTCSPSHVQKRAGPEVMGESVLHKVLQPIIETKP